MLFHSATIKQNQDKSSVSLVSRVPSFCCDRLRIEIHTSIEISRLRCLISVTFDFNRGRIH